MDKAQIFTLTPLRVADIELWSDMRAMLWPDTSLAAHQQELARLLAMGNYWGYLARDADGAPVGFCEVGLRDYVNGAHMSPAPMLEGIYVHPDFRQCGVGRQLMAAVSDALKKKGFTELCSDVEISNITSQKAHEKWGFCEMERVVYYRKTF